MSDANDQAERDAEIKKVLAALERYQNTGKMIATTVITLAAGGIYGLKPAGEPSVGLALALFLPMALALLHQLCHYLG